jgi:sulfatase modifying factor 1
VTADNGFVAPTSGNLACIAALATWTPTAGSQENLPINCLNWYEAYAFCIWDGGFLPSESEWEYAAAGGSQQREYPWGSTDPGTANRYAIYGCYYDPNDAGLCPGVSNFAPVGAATSGAGRWGQLDLAGNLFQWSVDWEAPYTACSDCAANKADLAAVNARMMRGGDCHSSASFLLPPYRRSGGPSDSAGEYGVRCARSPI